MTTTRAEGVPTVSIAFQTIKGQVDENRIWGQFQVQAIVSLDTVYTEFIIDGEVKETYSSQHTTGYLWFNFKTEDYMTGEHVIQVKVYDAAGESGTESLTKIFDPLAGFRPWLLPTLVTIVVLSISLGALIGRRERRLWLSLSPHCPNCRKTVGKDSYYCPHCGQPLLLTEKEELTVPSEDLEIKVEELAHGPGVKRILVLDSIGTFYMEILVTPKEIRKRRFNILQGGPMPRSYTVIVERMPLTHPTS